MALRQAGESLPWLLDFDFQIALAVARFCWVLDFELLWVFVEWRVYKSLRLSHRCLEPRLQYVSKLEARLGDRKLLSCPVDHVDFS